MKTPGSETPGQSSARIWNCARARQTTARHPARTGLINGGVALMLVATFLAPANVAAVDFYWRGQAGAPSDNIDQGANWWSGHNPSSGDNLYFNNTESRHWPYCNYGSGAWFGDIVTYNGAGGIKWRGDKTYCYKFENYNDPSLLEAEAVLSNRTGPDADLEINPVGSGGVTVNSVVMQNGRQLKVYGNNTLTVNGVISQSGSGNATLAVLGAATVVLNAVNSYGGDTTISAGKITIDSDATLGNGNGTLHLGGGTLNTSASRSVTVAPVANPIDLTADSAITTTSSASDVDLNLSSSTIGGSGGTLTFRNDGANAATDTFKPRFSGSGFTFGRPMVIDNGAVGKTVLNLFNTSGDQQFDGVISGSGAINRSVSSGAGGRTIFTAANTYSGGTTINAGTLLVNNTSGSGTGSGAVTVNSGGTLGGSGIISGAVTINAGGTLAPGTTSIGVLTINNTVTLSGNANFRINKSGGTLTSDQVAGATSVTAGGTLNVSRPAGDALAGGETFTLFNVTPGSTFSSTNLPGLGAGLNWWSENNYRTITVNRAPVANPAAYTRGQGTPLKIKISDLLSTATTDADGNTRSLDSINTPTAPSQGSASLSGDYILYTPTDLNSTTGDSFSYAISDGRGGTATGTINVTVVTSAGGLVQTLDTSGGGSVTVYFSGIPGYKYDIQRADDAGFTVNVTTLESQHVAPGNGQFSYTDTSPPQPSAYYRLKYNP